MSFLHKIKNSCLNTTHFIKNLLNIKDNNITFPAYSDALSDEIVHDVPSKVFSGLLSYPENPHCSPDAASLVQTYD